MLDKDNQYDGTLDRYLSDDTVNESAAERSARLARQDRIYHAAILIYALTVFTVDLSLKQGIAAGVPYLFAVWIAYHAPNKNTLWITAIGCSALTVLGVILSMPGFDMHVVAINRVLALSAIWGTALLCHQSRRAHDALREREQQVREIIEHSPTAMLMTDPNGNIVLSNAATTALFGYSAQELLGKPVELLIPEPVRAHHPVLRRAFTVQPHARRMGGARDLHALHKDGHEVSVEIGLTPFLNNGIPYVLSSIVDISHRKALEANLRTVNDELETRIEERTADLQAANDALVRSNTELQQFAYIASHDLQTPLRSISGFTQLLAEEYGDRLDPQAHDWIRRTVDNTKRMHTLIRDLLSYSRVDSRASPFTQVDLNALVKEIGQIYETDLKIDGGRIVCEPLPNVRGDPSQLSQLFTNLIGNGLKYRKYDPPVVHISAYRDGNEWVIRVRDNGIGIDPKHHDNIFEIFKRLHTNQTYPGTGIGLAVCRRVVHRHGGRIWVESEPGQGSTFYFSLPCREADEA